MPFGSVIAASISFFLRSNTSYPTGNVSGRLLKAEASVRRPIFFSTAAESDETDK
jgi:hypothetical protein